MPEQSGEITRLLRAWGEGDGSALDELAPVVSAELHRIARRRMRRENKGHTLQTAELVNEAWLRLIGGAAVDWKERAHFYALSAETMRRILVDWARAKVTVRREAGVRAERIDWNQIPAMEGSGRELVALDDALEALGKMDARKAKVIELRFFGGLSIRETAAVLKISEESVQRDWRLAKAWLGKAMAGKD